MNEFLQVIQPSIVTALGLVLTALTGFVVSYINKKNKELQGNIDSNLAKKYMDMVAQTITDCVKEVSQTYVDSIKKEGAFTGEKQIEAFTLAYNNVMNILNKDVLEYLQEVTGDVDKFITSKIESEVKDQKK